MERPQHENNGRESFVRGDFAAKPAYTEQQAAQAAAYCLNCKDPRCVSGCPASNPIPEFIAAIKDGDHRAAVRMLRRSNCFPSMCGRVCQQEKQCEKNCVRGIKGKPVSIGMLETYAAERCAADHRAAKQSGDAERIAAEFSPFADAAPQNGIKIAIIGTGPSSMACATELIKKGYEVTLFDKFEHEGGVPAYGIPEFRLPYANLEYELELLREAGAKFEKGRAFGADFTADDLFERGYAAIYVGVGLSEPSDPRMGGIDAKYVFSASEFLRRVNGQVKFGIPSGIDIAGKRTVIIGGGNVAMDAARCAVRMNAANVDIIYRRTQNELPACRRETEEAAEEGIGFKYLTAPVAVVKNDAGEACGLECIKMKLGEPDDSGRARPEKIDGSEHIIAAECVIYATGERPGGEIAGLGLALGQKGLIRADEDGRTSDPRIFAAGDIVSGADTVIRAIVGGKNAALAIDRYASGSKKD